jgi:hypothetical protein
MKKYKLNRNNYLACFFASCLCMSIANANEIWKCEGFSYIPDKLNLRNAKQKELALKLLNAIKVPITVKIIQDQEGYSAQASFNNFKTSSTTSDIRVINSLVSEVNGEIIDGDRYRITRGNTPDDWKIIFTLRGSNDFFDVTSVSLKDCSATNCSADTRERKDSSCTTS